MASRHERASNPRSLRWTVQPLSKFRRNWDYLSVRARRVVHALPVRILCALQVLVHAYTAVITPFELSFLEERPLFVFICDRLQDVFCAADILVNIRSAELSDTGGAPPASTVACAVH